MTLKSPDFIPRFNTKLKLCSSHTNTLVWYHHQTHSNLLIDPLLSPATYMLSYHRPQAVLWLDPNQKGLMQEKEKKKPMIYHQALAAYFFLLPKEGKRFLLIISPHGCSSERQEMALSYSQPWASVKREKGGFSRKIFLCISRSALRATNAVSDLGRIPLIPLCNISCSCI